MDLNGYLRTTHLVENARIQLAIDYLVHEFAKIIPTTPHGQIRQSIQQQAPDAQSDDVIIRDFWNLFSSVSSGWRLKDLVYPVTARNFRWERRLTSLSQLLPSEETMSWFQHARPYSLARALAALRSGLLKEGRSETQRHRGNRHPEDALDPLIGFLRPDGMIRVVDGNGRLKARIETVAERPTDDGSREQLEVWTGASDGSAPQDFWMPTSSMQFALLFAKGDERLVERLEEWIAARSFIAAREFAERVAPP